MYRQAENIKPRWTIVNGLRLYSLVAENPLFNKKPSIVLVQGLAIVAHYWIPAISELSKNFNVYTLDLPGYGESDKPSHILDISELSDALDAWMAAMEINRAVLIGHSFGCQIVATFALRHSERIQRIVLAAPTFEKGARNSLKQFLRLALDAANEPLSLIWLAIYSLFRFGLIRQVQTMQFALTDRIEDKLSYIDIPTLVLRGSRDTVVPQNWAEEVAKMLLQSKLTVILGGTHGLNYTFPKEFATSIQEFLDD